MHLAAKFPRRLAFCGILLLYLIGDLWIFSGPLRQKIDLADPASPAALAHARAQGIIARVAGRPISESQLARAISERLWLEGKTTADLTPEALQATREAALHDLIDHELLAAAVSATPTAIAVDDEEIHARLRRLVGRFESKGALETAMKTQGIRDEPALRARLASQIRQEKFIAAQIDAVATVTDDAARAWFEKNHATLAFPERIALRHIFIPTLGTPPDAAKQTLEAALASLTAKTKDFLSLAREVSQDPATKDVGGSLGWTTRDRLPADFAAPVFSLETHVPSLVRSKLGWHLVEVTARKPAEPQSFDLAKPEIRNAMENLRRRDASQEFRAKLRQARAHEIQIIGI